MSERDFNEEDLKDLDQTLLKGINSITHGDKSVSYRSLDEMIRLKTYFKSQLETKRSNTRVYESFSKGLLRDDE